MAVGTAPPSETPEAIAYRELVDAGVPPDDALVKVARPVKLEGSDSGTIDRWSWAVMLGIIPSPPGPRYRLLLMNIALYPDIGGESLAPDELAQSCGETLTTTRRRLAELCECGAITWDSRGILLDTPITPGMSR